MGLRHSAEIEIRNIELIRADIRYLNRRIICDLGDDPRTMAAQLKLANAADELAAYLLQIRASTH
jgi:hypothetical protein